MAEEMAGSVGTPHSPLAGPAAMAHAPGSTAAPKKKANP